MTKMRLLAAGATLAIVLTAFFLQFSPAAEPKREEGEEEETENLWDRYQQEFEQLRDPATGVVPAGKLGLANEFTKAAQRNAAASRTTGLTWQERGPIYDVVGPSNGNSRAGSEYTAGIVQSFVVDAADASGNTVLAGSPSGGLWRCTNFLANAPANWQPVNDFMPNLAVAALCQSPANPNIMYMATGDGNTRDVRGYGVWKSTNGGLNWSLLPSTTGFTTAFKILCDNAGNVYFAGAGALTSTTYGLRRSTDGGATWTLISPAGLTASNGGYVTDMEISSSGRLHVVFGYYGTKVQHFYTDAPATVSPVAGWTESTGIRASGVACARMEMATQGATAYAVTCNTSFHVDSCYKSVDGGATWTLQNTVSYTPAYNITNTQGWYALELDINPDNPDEFWVGSVDAWRSTNGGLTLSRATYWVGLTAPYVHADHHAIKWFKAGGENRLIIGCDGGMFVSRNGGFTFVDRNQNLGIKQFYSCAISPTAGENFLFGGTQDNGCHQLKQPGLGSSTETTGGDGAYVHINQKDPQVQFGSYIYNQYRRSINGGTNWSSVNVSSTGYFINPFDYDDALNVLYASNAGSSTTNQIRRLNDANTAIASSSTVVPISAMMRNGTAGNATSFKVSPYTANRLFIGTSRGGLLRLENAATVTAADADANTTDITGSGFPVGGYLNCVNTGSSDNVLVATFTNYGVNNIWVSTNGGTSWTAVDGNLPDMPVWWAVFVPGNDNKLMIATETGVFATDALNGGSTVWTPEAGFPIVRTRMLKIRASDNTIVAATYGRGLWTASFGGGCTLSTINTQPTSQAICVGSAVTFTVGATGTGMNYQWRKGGVNIAGATGGSFQIAAVSAADAANYDVVITNSCGSVTSTAATLTVNQTLITSQTSSGAVCAGSSASFSVVASGQGTLSYQWLKNGVAIAGATGNTYNIASTVVADAGRYSVRVTGNCGSVTSNEADLAVNTGGGCVTALPNIDPTVTGAALLPNLVQQNAVLRTTVQRAMTVNWQVVDLQGRVVMRFSQRLTAGRTDLRLQLGSLAAGRYLLHGATDKGRLETLRFTKL